MSLSYMTSNKDSQRYCQFLPKSLETWYIILISIKNIINLQKFISIMSKFYIDWYLMSKVIKILNKST